MDTKRFILAIVLAFIVIAGYTYFFAPKPPPPQPQKEVQTAAEQATAKKAVYPQDQKKSDNSDFSDLFSTPKKEIKKIDTAKEVTENIKGTGINDRIVVETDLFKAVFTNKGAGLTSFVLKKYNDDSKEPQLLDLISRKVDQKRPYPFHFSPFEDAKIYGELNNQVYAHSLEKSGDKTILTFRFADKAQNLSVFKRFTFSKGSYIIDLGCELIQDGQPIPTPLVFGPDLENNVNKGRALQQALKISALNREKVHNVEFSKIKTQVRNEGDEWEIARSALDGFYFWAAYGTSYFAAIFKTEDNKSSIRYAVAKQRSIDRKNKSLHVFSYIIIDNPSAVYLGPKDEEILASMEETFYQVNKAIQYGWFGSIAKIMQKGISIAHKIVPNYGWAIILFTLFLKILLFPLTYTSSVSMAKMQALQPKIKAIKKKYKNQKDSEQRKQMNVETMALYKAEKVNPAGGCLPLLLQLPILWGLFRFLAVSINVRHEPWMLWITDLSLKDPIYVIPILMGLTQILLQKMSPTSGDAAQNKMMYIMPVVITFFVMQLPSGLTLYWFASNLLQIAQQHFINKRIFQKRKEDEKIRKQQKKKKGALHK